MPTFVIQLTQNSSKQIFDSPLLFIDLYNNDSTRPVTSATLIRDPFRYRHRQSPAGELSDKVIHTLRQNLESYVRDECLQKRK